MSLRTVLAANLRLLRSEKGLSQEELADLSELTRNYIGALEREEYSASVDTLEKVAKALGVPASRLLEKKANRSSPKR